MSAAYKINVLRAARAELSECRAAFAAAEAAAYDSCGLVRSAAALQAFSRASDALADAIYTFKEMFDFACSRDE
jgi:hypothetical protein